MAPLSVMFYRSKKVKIDFMHVAVAGHKILVITLCHQYWGEFVFRRLRTVAEF